MEPRRFLILPNPIQAEDLPCLLGKITIDYTSPLDHAVPDDPRPLIQGCTRGVLQETAARTWGSAKTGSVLYAALKPFAKVTYSANKEETYSMDTSLIRTYSLKYHDRVFERIWEAHSKAVQELLDLRSWRLGILPEKMYMVTGYKTVLDSTRAETHSDEVKVSGSGTAPVGAPAAAATAGAVPANAAVKVMIETTRSEDGGKIGTLVGETAVAVEYHTYKRSQILAMLKEKSWGRSITDAHVKLFPGGRAMAGGAARGVEEKEEEPGQDLLLELDSQDCDKFELVEGEEDDFYVPKDITIGDKVT